MEMIQPNKLKQAQQELATISFNNGFEIPTEISEKEAKYYYVCVGVKAKNTRDNFGKIYDGKTLYATIKKWNKMKREIKLQIFKREFGDLFDKIILLHDPFYKPVEKVKDLSPKQKKAVNELLEEGKSVAEISKELTLDVKRIKAYLK